jgi:predicted RNA-binding protein YlxR (DUF448 family)
VTTSRKTPTRTCIGCGEAKDKRDLVRLVRTPSGDVEVDPSGKTNGRGAYLCSRQECFETAASRARISAALKTSVRDDDIDRLMREFAEVLSARNS